MNHSIGGEAANARNWVEGIDYSRRAAMYSSIGA